MEKMFSKVEKYILYGTIFLFPVVAFQTSTNPFVVSKTTLLVLAILLLLLSKAAKVIVSGKLNLSVSSFDLPVAIIMLSYVLSTVLRTPNKMEALLLPGTTTIVVAAGLMYFLVNQLKQDGKNTVSTLLFFSGVLYSVMLLLASTGILDKVPQLPAFIRSKAFTPEGGYLPSTIFLGVLLPVGLGHFISAKSTNYKALAGVSIAVVAGALAFSIYQILPGRPLSPRFPGMSISWSIAVDALKSSPLFGVGPGNYVTAFNRFRPIEFNNTDLWAVKYATGTNFYITMLTEVGLLGAAGFVLLLVGFYNFAKREVRERKLVNWGFVGTANIISLIMLVVLIALFPGTLLLIVLLFILFALNVKSHATSLNLLTSPIADNEKLSAGSISSRVPALLVALPVILLVGFLGFRSTRIVLAEYRFTQSLRFLVQNNAAKTYDTMRAAISLNPLVDRYHTTFSRVNFAIANSLAQKAGTDESGQSTLTDADRQQITVLIQQAINEAKAGVALNPLRSGNWEILARTYQSIIPLAQGADNFAVQSMTQAVVLDPLNPNLRVALGGLYFAQGDYDNAVRVFELAVATKPDLANSHYNLAFAYREKGRLDEAIQQMTLVLSMIDKSSPDYQTAKTALENMQEQKKTAAPVGEELNPPQPAPSPAITPKVELPEESQPPVAPLSPTPTPQETTEGGLPLSPTPTPLP